MTEPQHDWWSPAVTMGIALFAAVWWVIRRLFSVVTRGELEEKMQTMHEENVERLEGLRNDIRGVHERIDDLYADLMRK